MCDDYFETHHIDDLMEWENEQVFRDGINDLPDMDPMRKLEEKYNALCAAIWAHREALFNTNPKNFQDMTDYLTQCSLIDDELMAKAKEIDNA